MFKYHKTTEKKLLGYMQNRPYAEVFTLIAMLVGFKTS